MKSWDIVKAAQMACIFEASSHKPGNVSRLADFEDLKYEEFLACGVAIGEIIFEACEAARKNELKTGLFIRRAAEESKKWSSSNVNLGIILLFAPISQAASLSDFSALRGVLGNVCNSSTMEDALMVCKAIEEASPRGMGSVEKYDVTTEAGRRQIIEEGKTLFNLFQFSQNWDGIAREWVNNFPMTFDVGLPSLNRIFFESNDVDNATRIAFLEILSVCPDTLIQRKMGRAVAEKISLEARALLKDYSEEKAEELDKRLRTDRRLNPGTTADLTASSLFVFMLERIEKGLHF